MAQPTKISAMPPSMESSCVPFGLRFIQARAMPARPNSNGMMIWLSAPVLANSRPMAINTNPDNATNAGLGRGGWRRTMIRGGGDRRLLGFRFGRTIAAGEWRLSHWHGICRIGQGLRVAGGYEYPQEYVGDDACAV